MEPLAAQPGTMVNVMSVDVEDYFQVSAFDAVVSRADWPRFPGRVVDNTCRLLDLFDEAGIRSTCFVLGWVARAYPTLVPAIAARGHEVASHGFWHQLVYDLDPDAFREDVRSSKALLEAQSGQPVLGYRAPSYSITTRSLWALDVLVEEGFRYDASIFPIRHDRYGIPDAPRHPHVIECAAGPLLEIPPATTRLGTNMPVAGGGYFRLLPYAYTRWGIGRVNAQEGKPAVFYLHPWEIDADQPRLQAGAVSRFRHYRNLHLTERRLRALLNDFPFAPMRDVFAAELRGLGAR